MSEGAARGRERAGQAGWERLNVIPLPITRCNAACDYCFEIKGGPAMTPADAGRMFEAFATYARTRPSLGRVSFFWQGGEPLLLTPEWFEDALERCTRTFADTNVHVEHALQTNLLLYDSRWAPVLRRYFGGELGSSYDVPNLRRRTAQGSLQDYDTTWRGRLAAARADGLAVGVIAIPNEGTLELGARAFFDRLFGELGLRQVQVNLPFPPAARVAHAGGKPSLDPRRLSAFLVDLYALWRGEGRTRGLTLSPLAELDERVRSGRGQLPCLFAANCAETFLSIGPEGQVGLCDCWTTSYPELHFGNIFRDRVESLLAANPVRGRYFGRTERLLAGECGECRHLAICFGGCPVRAYAFTGRLDERDPYCEVYRALFLAVEAAALP